MKLPRIFKNDYIRDDAAFRKMCIIYGACIFVCLLLVIVLNAYREQQEASAAFETKQVNEYRTFISKHQEEEQQYEKLVASYARPIKKSEVDRAQNQIMEKISHYQLDIRGMQMLKTAAPPSELKPLSEKGKPAAAPKKPLDDQHGVEYEVIIVGSWENSMRFLNDLRTQPFLLNLKKIAMESAPNTSTIKTTFKYKIYTEEG